MKTKVIGLLTVVMMLLAFTAYAANAETQTYDKDELADSVSINSAAVNYEDDVYKFDVSFTDVPYDCQLITVLYNDKGEMTGSAITPITTTDTQKTVALSADSADKAKVFIWDGLDGIKPLCAPTDAVVTKKENQSSDTFHVCVYISNVMYENKDIPDINLLIVGKNGSDTLTLTKDDFNSGLRSYSGECNIGSFDAGDEISISYTNTTEDTYYLTLSQDSNTVTIKNEPVTYKIESFTYQDPDDTEPTTCVYGKNVPLSLSINKKTTPSTITLLLKDENGDTLPNIDILVSTYNYSVKKYYTSDKNGTVDVDFSYFGNNSLYVRSCTEDYVINNGNATYSTIYLPKEGRVYTINFERVEDEDEEPVILTSKINLSYTGKTALFDPNSITLSLDIANEDDKYTIDYLCEGENSVDLLEGTYTVTSARDYLPLVKEYSLVSGQPLDVEYTATYTLKVINSDDEDLRGDYFEVINIDSLKNTQFDYDEDYGVLPGQSIMLRDPKSLKAYTVAILDDSTEATVDIATGKITYSAADE